MDENRLQEIDGYYSQQLQEANEEIGRLKKWVDDLHSGMYINCVYCGHRYGPSDEVPASMANVLKEHIERCPDHPMSKLKIENERLSDGIAGMLLLSDDYTRNQNERFAMISTRARKPLKGGE